jgi:putative endonuclease
MSKKTQVIGRQGESIAVNYLIDLGYQIVEINARTAVGEIDIVAQDCGIPVFVEVKTRSSKSLARPEAAVTPKKQASMLAAAETYLQGHPELPEEFRIDVIAIVLRPAPPQITHFEDALS